MKPIIYSLFFALTLFVTAQNSSDKALIEETLNNYIDGFYKGDSLKLKAALKPRLYKFGYWKNKNTNAYEYSSQMTFDEAMAYANRVLKNNNQKGDEIIRKVEVLDSGNHIAAGKITAWWGIDFVLLSKEDGKWMIEQVIWEGPLEKSHVDK
ncbi:MAG: hypothetical protein HKN40_14275 [Winogradskyella sp.]|uniref:nuclear transport factor 2 family protein n=1 Tax=Winogradskyella sp. TaxID=1883156 RepID=UPI0017CFB81B|nr:hypothetical protein [Winogradskyella sp.]